MVSPGPVFGMLTLEAGGVVVSVVCEGVLADGEGETVDGPGGGVCWVVLLEELLFVAGGVGFVLVEPLPV